MASYMLLFRSVEGSTVETSVLHSDSMNATGYFFDSFHFRANWWSCCMLARNFLLCAAFTLHNGFLTPVMKGEIGIAVSLIYLCTLLHVKPFVVRNMNRVEALFVNTEIIIVLFGILFSSDEQFSNSAFLEALQLVFLFGVYLLAALMMNLHFWGMLYEKYGKFWWCRVALRDSTESTETLIDSIWTADDADVIKGVLLQKMYPGVSRPRLRELKTFENVASVKRSKGDLVGVCRKLQDLCLHKAAISYKSHDTFWHDLVRAFPRILGWILHTLSSATSENFRRDKEIIFDVLNKLRELKS